MADILSWTPPTLLKIGIHFFPVLQVLLVLVVIPGMIFFFSGGRPTNPPRLAGASAFQFDNTDCGHSQLLTLQRVDWPHHGHVPTLSEIIIHASRRLLSF